MDSETKQINLDKLRTIMANERTLLAYIRTCFAALIFGLAALRFFPDNLYLSAIGWVAIVSGLVILLRGIIVSEKRREMIRWMK